MPVPTILVFAGSVRSGASTEKLATAAARQIAASGGAVNHVSLADYPMPFVDGDLLASEGVPETAKALARLIAASDGCFVVTPEYSYSLPPLLKNALDWVSRLRPEDGIEYRGKVWALASASGNAYGGVRAIVELRKVVTTATSALVLAEQVTLNFTATAFNEAGDLSNEAQAKSLRMVAERLVDIARRLAPQDGATRAQNAVRA